MKKLCLTAAAAALLVLTACGAKKTASAINKLNSIILMANTMILSLDSSKANFKIGYQPQNKKYGIIP